MSATKYITEAATLEKKCRTWKANPRRSLGLPSGDEWARHLDGFSIPEKNETDLKRRVTQKSLARAANSNELASQNTTDISDYSSSDDVGFEDIKPLDPTSPQPTERQVVKVGHSAKRKRSRPYLSRFDLSKRKESEINITADSPAKPPKLLKRDDEGCNHIEVESPADKRKGFIQPSFSQGSNTSAQDYSICDYESLSQATTQDKDSSQSTKMSEAESPLISAASSLTSDGEVQQAKRSSSQWLQNLQWDAGRHNKHSEDDQAPPPPLEDSAKKKKQKFRKEGLADRLQKLTRRKQSTQNIWNHRMATPQQKLPDVSKSLVVELLSAEWEYSVLVCRCRHAPTDQGPGSTAEHCRQHTLTVLFTASTAKRLGLKTRSVVQIYPPWQSFDSNMEGKVVLCTLFCQLLPSLPGSTNTEHAKLYTDKVEELHSKGQTIATWSCPCIQDGTFPRNSCQAQLEPSHTDLSLRLTSDTASQSVGSPACRLHTEILSQAGSQVTTGILESIENQGGFGACGITLRATVQRVFYRSTTSSSSEGSSRPPGLAPSAAGPTVRVSVLLQDSRGTCCEVTLPPRAELLDTWRPLCKDGEGKVWSFTGLRQHCRTNRNRDPCLFHVIDSVSPAEGISMPDTSSQSDSQQSQQRCIGRTSQAFCYRLLAPSGESACKLVGPAPTPRPSVFYHLADISGAVSRKPRLTVICKIIFIHPQDTSGMNSPQHWFVIDSSLSSISDSNPQGYCKVRIQSACWLSPAVLEELHAPQPVVVLKDVLAQDGQYICDGYSCLYPASAIQTVKEQLTLYSDMPLLSELRGASPTIANIAQLSSVSSEDLITVSGVLTGVNENTAYTWEVCGHCNSSDLQPNPTNRHTLCCRGCGRTVDTPETRINLEVYTRLQTTLQSKPITAKVKLLQKTIESLLPDESTDEGYDVQCVLGKELGPLPCVITSMVRTSTTTDTTRDIKELHLQQVTLTT